MPASLLSTLTIHLSTCLLTLHRYSCPPCPRASGSFEPPSPAISLFPHATIHPPSPETFNKSLKLHLKSVFCIWARYSLNRTEQSGHHGLSRHRLCSAQLQPHSPGSFLPLSPSAGLLMQTSCLTRSFIHVPSSHIVSERNYDVGNHELIMRNPEVLFGFFYH